MKLKNTFVSKFGRKGIHRLALNAELINNIGYEVANFEDSFDFSYQRYLFEGKYQSLETNDDGNIILTKQVENYFMKIEIDKYKPNYNASLINLGKKLELEQEFVDPLKNMTKMYGQDMGKDFEDIIKFDAYDELKQTTNDLKLKLKLKNLKHLDNYDRNNQVSNVNENVKDKISKYDLISTSKELEFNLIIKESSVIIKSIGIYLNEEQNDDNSVIVFDTSHTPKLVEIKFDILNETLQSYFIDLIDKYFISSERDIKLIKYFGIYSEISNYVRTLRAAQNLLI